MAGRIAAERTSAFSNFAPRSLYDKSGVGAVGRARDSGLVNVYLSSVFCLLALAGSANSIRRRIASEREDLSFCF
jgi:hypothetical protein